MSTPSCLVRRRWLLAIAALPLATCGMLPPPDMKPPRLRFSDLRVTDLGIDDIRFVLTIEAENPNDFDLPLRDVGFDLELIGQPVASGSALERRLTLPRLGRRTVPVEFTVTHARLIDVLRHAQYSDPAAIGYRLKGSALWGNSGIALQFDRRGDLSALRGLAELILRQRSPQPGITPTRGDVRS